MDVDPTKNVVAFQIEGHDPYIGDGPTQDDHCVEQIWSRAPAKLKNTARKVNLIHSEWEPSKADANFIRRTFPNAELTYNFERPEPDGWDAALAAARQAIMQEIGTGAMEQVDKDGELLPILWSQTSPNIQMLQMLPHRDLVPGKLQVALATVAATPEGRIGMNHVGLAGLDGQSFEDALDAAFATLTRGLRIEGLADPNRSGEMAMMRRRGPFASSAVALPDFYEQISSMLRGDRVLVGLPDPDTVLATLADSGWVDELQRLVLTSPSDSREFVPCILAFEPSGIRFVTERSR